VNNATTDIEEKTMKELEDWVDVCPNCGYSDRGLDDVELAEVEG